MQKTCIILGAGGHTRVLIDCLQYSEDVTIFGILDPNPDIKGRNIFTIPIIGNDELLDSLRSQGVNYFVIGLGGTGNNMPRIKLYNLALKYGLKPLTVRHPSAIISTRATIGEGSQLLPGCIINTAANIGINCIINSGAIIEHDCIIGNHVHIATGAKLASTVQVGEGAHIGAGSTIRQLIKIGEYSVIGAGAVVVKDVQPRTTVVGIPASLLQKEK
jgi:sugar O-acyltransferase (sialic acid O-acetyltransferase NeuD family)